MAACLAEAIPPRAEAVARPGTGLGNLGAALVAGPAEELVDLGLDRVWISNRAPSRATSSMISARSRPEPNSASI